MYDISPVAVVLDVLNRDVRCTWYIAGKRNVLHKLDYSDDGCYLNDEEGCVQDYAIPEKITHCLPL